MHRSDAQTCLHASPRRVHPGVLVSSDGPALDDLGDQVCPGESHAPSSVASSPYRMTLVEAMSNFLASDLFSSQKLTSFRPSHQLPFSRMLLPLPTLFPYFSSSFVFVRASALFPSQNTSQIHSSLSHMVGPEAPSGAPSGTFSICDLLCCFYFFCLTEE